MPRALDDWLESYLEYTHETEPRKTFREWCASSAIAAVMQRKCFLRLGLETFYPNLYIVLVGPPASRKGTAMKPAREMLDKLGILLAADESSRQKLVHKMEHNPQMVTYDNGVVDFHTSLTIFSTELTVFLGYNNTDLLGILCKWFDCESRFEYDTILHGEQEIVNVWVNLIGATTPRLIQASLPEASIGSGFTSRTIFVFEDNKEKVVIYPRYDAELQSKLLQDLEHIKIMQGEFKAEKGFFAKYGEWRLAWEAHPPFNVPSLEYYLQRRQVHLLKLCMIHSASRSDDQVVRIVDFDRALTMLERAERNMPRVFEGVGRNPLAEVQVRVVKEIALRKKLHFSELINMFYNDVSSRELAEIIGTLQERRFCTIDPRSGIVKFTKQKEKEDADRQTEV